MPTPLLDALERLAQCQPLRMAMPGHKGRAVCPLGTQFSRLDFTELPPTGNLYAPGGPIEAAEALWAARWHKDACLFLTGGSTQGIHTALLCAARPGSAVLVDRLSHRSIHTGLALLDLNPRWLHRPWLERVGTAGAISPAAVEKALSQDETIKTVCITSPTYYGVLSDIPVLAALCHRQGAALVVDAAHGAHLPLLCPGVYEGADLVVVSAHKTLRAPGQSALLFARSPFSLECLREASMCFATSSPSYPMMAALDWVRDYYEAEGAAAYRRTAERTAALRRDYPSLTDTHAPLDPTRFTLCVEDGFAVEAALQARGIYPEMADRNHVVFILTDCDEEADVLRLRRALDELGLRRAALPALTLGAPPLPEQVCAPRHALFGARERVPWTAAAGRVAAEQIAPYPPGVSVIAPGERIRKKALFYLEQIGYNREAILCAAEEEHLCV